MASVLGTEALQIFLIFLCVNLTSGLKIAAFSYKAAGGKAISLGRCRRYTCSPDESFLNFFCSTVPDSLLPRI